MSNLYHYAHMICILYSACVNTSEQVHCLHNGACAYKQVYSNDPAIIIKNCTVAGSNTYFCTTTSIPEDSKKCVQQNGFKIL